MNIKKYEIFRLQSLKMDAKTMNILYKEYEKY